MTDKELLEAAKAISENCMNREKCEGCLFEHTGKNHLDNFCIVQETICCWKEYIEQLEKQVEYYRRIATIWQDVAGRLNAILELAGDDDVCKG